MRASNAPFLLSTAAVPMLNRRINEKLCLPLQISIACNNANGAVRQDFLGRCRQGRAAARRATEEAGL